MPQGFWKKGNDTVGRRAVISEGVYARYMHGAMGRQADDAGFLAFKLATEGLAERALDAMNRL